MSYWLHGRVDLLAGSSYSHLAAHCASIPPISSAELLSRQALLAKSLHALGAAAYIAEPGANTQFFANFSKAQWSLSERPLLLIITPVVSDSEDGEIYPRITVLTPKFEATRAKMLPIPSPDGAINYVEWAEETDPYTAALSVLPTTPQADNFSSQKIFVDNSIRKFIVDGLYRASASEPSFGFSHSLSTNSTDAGGNPPAQAVHHEPMPVRVFSAPIEITQMRERKSEAELRILKCVNEATLLAIRDVHKRLVPGIRESYARSMMATALGAAGLKDGGCLTLFGENAALPHGSGTDRVLADTDFALFDCTASLHGYYSDVTRTVALSPSSPLTSEQLSLWRLVHSAQTIALTAARNGTVAHSLGWDQYFTHRLGHGIGLEVHEAPYLHGGSDDIIRVGHTFSDEPGLYIEGKVGVRLEDCFYINEDGVGVFLTAGVGGQSDQPWLP
ncbi:peptidase M24, structural domain-containing protein [Flammula alnicola]|nr:peptidase M24, structural domain-containing protein [Flammula alnicola]